MVRARFVMLLPAALCLFAPAAAGQQAGNGPAERISAAALRAHVSFLASDLLEGRDTPSRGLDVAAEYLAAQFRRLELEPLGDDGYFQTSACLVAESDPEGLRIQVSGPAGGLDISAAGARPQAGAGCDAAAVPVVARPLEGTVKSDADAAGKAVALLLPEDSASGSVSVERLRGRLRAIEKKRPALILVVGDLPAQHRFPRRQLVYTAAKRPPPGVPLAHIFGEPARRLQRLLSSGGPFEVSARWNRSVERGVTVRNVVGRLPGSDPALKETAVLVSAHYDHIGMLEEGEGDRVYNGANDDASGAASVVEIAAALARAPLRPPRSVIFALFFGEERGMLGAGHYAAHPPVPLSRTIANLNLEHMGRSDGPGAARDRLFVTGFDYSTVPAAIASSAATMGMEARRDEERGDLFFSRGDNIVFARQGVPAHSVCTTFLFSDYHQLGDHWDKLDYPNMARATEAVASAVAALASDAREPSWNEAEPRTELFRKARQKPPDAGR